MGETVRLRGGGPVEQPGEPDAGTIEVLEKLLEQARSGEVNGVAFASRYRDGTTTIEYAGWMGRAVIGALFALMNLVSRSIGDGPE